MRHQASDLIQMQSIPLDIKIKMTKRRIEEWYDAFEGMVYVSFSGGKDSTVLKHIVDSMYSDVPSVFCNTGLEYPEIQKFAMSQPGVTVVYPKMGFVDVIKKYGYPVISKEVAKNVFYAKRGNEHHYKKLFGTFTWNGEKSSYCTEKYSYLYDAPFNASPACCDVMKKAPMDRYARESGRKMIVGTMACESRQRTLAWVHNGCNAFEAKKPRSAPLSFWTEQDILHYLKKYDVPYCSVYGDIVSKVDVDGQISLGDITGDYDHDTLGLTGNTRTGCIFCMFGCHLEDEPNRFQRLKQTHPKQYAYCIGGGHFQDGKWMPDSDGLGLGYVLDYIGVKY